MSDSPTAPDVLESGGLLLRRVRDDDATALTAAFADPAIATWNASTAADVVEWMNGRRRADATKSTWIVEVDGIALAGCVSLFPSTLFSSTPKSIIGSYPRLGVRA